MSPMTAVWELWWGGRPVVEIGKMLKFDDNETEQLDNLN